MSADEVGWMPTADVGTYSVRTVRDPRTMYTMAAEVTAADVAAEMATAEMTTAEMTAAVAAAVAATAGASESLGPRRQTAERENCGQCND